jgi:hypothetical protein
MTEEPCCGNCPYWEYFDTYDGEGGDVSVGYCLRHPPRIVSMITEDRIKEDAGSDTAFDIPFIPFVRDCAFPQTKEDSLCGEHPKFMSRKALHEDHPDA